MIKSIHNADIILCTVIKRINTYEYFIKSYLSSNKRFFNQETIMVEPRYIYVNGIRFKAQFADQFFIDTTLKGKKSLFAIEELSDDHIVGDIFLLPTSKNLPMELPDKIMQMVERFSDSEFRLAV